MMRIVQVANYVTDRSGGQRRTLLELGRRYVEAGHSCTLVVPGDRRHLVSDSGVDVIALPGTTVPTSGGYRMILRRRPLQRLLVGLGPDVVELSDKTTLAWLPGWLRDRGTPTVLLVHERHDELLRGAMPDWLPWRDVVRSWSGRAAAASAAVVCASAYSAGQFDAVEGANIVQVPLGVDLDVFGSGPALSRPVADAADDTVGLVYVGRLSPEKRPDLAVGALIELLRRGVPAHLTIVGDGPLRDGLAAKSLGLPVTFAGRVDDRAELAAIVGAARALLAPCPVETFGLAILEALACGTPAVVVDQGAAAELLTGGLSTGGLTAGGLTTGGTGAVAAPDAIAIADGVEMVLGGDRDEQAAACRAHAARYSWERTARSMLDLFEQARFRSRARAA